MEKIIMIIECDEKTMFYERENTMTEIIDNICDVLDVPGSVADGVKGQIAGIIQNGIDCIKWEKIFIKAGRCIASYENNGLQQNDFRNVLFSQENMKKLAKFMRNSDLYHFEYNLAENLNSLLSNSGMETYNQEMCLHHFIQIVKNDLKKYFPEVINWSLLAETRDNTVELRSDSKRQTDLLLQILENTQDLKSGQDYQRSSRRSVPFPDDSISLEDGLDWYLMPLDINIFDDSIDNQKSAAVAAIGQWKSEREQYPGWYIAPCEVHRRLQYKTLQYSCWIRLNFLELDDELELCYEFVWRCETGMLSYNGYLQKGIYEIWRTYLNKLKNQGEGTAEREEDRIRKWFYIGKVLLREYREQGQESEWENIFQELMPYYEVDLLAKAGLEIEKIKFAFSKFQMNKVRRLCERCQLPEKAYELQIQMIGLEAECGRTEQALKHTIEMLEKVRQECFGESDVYYHSIFIVLLHMESLLLQGIAFKKREYEKNQETINEILNQENQENVFLTGKAFLCMWSVNSQHGI